jgi:hypothetical protein
MKAQHRSKLHELGSAKWFRGDIGWIFARDMRNNDFALLNETADPVGSAVHDAMHVFHVHQQVRRHRLCSSPPRRDVGAGHENINNSDKVLAVTNHHVVCKVDDRLYDFRAHDSARQQVRVCGFRRFQRDLDEIRAAIVTTPVYAPKRLPSWRPMGTGLTPKPLTRLDRNWKSIERPLSSSRDVDAG